MPVKPIPDDYHRVTPYLIIEGVAELLEFLRDVFGAEEVHSTVMPDGTVMHAEVRIGDAKVMMGEAQPEWPAMPGSLYVFVEDTDATYQAALAAGATSVMEPADQFYGDRNGGVKDPHGNVWWIATRIENVSREELEERAARWGKGTSG